MVTGSTRRSTIMITFALYLVYSLGQLLPIVDAVCQSSLISLPIDNITLSNNANVYGVSIGVGTPVQNISLHVHTWANGTYIPGTNGFCDEEDFSATQCLTYRGGTYDGSNSSTETNTEDGQQNEPVDATWIADSFRLSPNLTLPDFPFGVPRKEEFPPWSPQGQMGLGSNSTLLSTLKTAGHIASRTFAIFWGLVGGPRRVPGSLVLGGYDKAIAGGSANYTAPLVFTSDCRTGMLVTINNIELNWPNGSDMSIFGDVITETLPVCIHIDYAGLMTLPDEYWDKFHDLAGGRYFDGSATEDYQTTSSGLNYNTYLFEPENVYDGDLTISILNGISIRVPNTELVVPEPTIVSSGKIIANNSAKNLVIESESVDNRFPTLNRLFLSSAYLMVNYDANTFTIWQAETNFDSSSLQPVGGDGELVGEVCDGPANTGGESSSTPSASSTPDSSSGKTLSGGAIGGIVVGVLFGVGMCIFLAFWIWRRKHSPLENAAVSFQPELVQTKKNYPGVSYSPAQRTDSSVQGGPKQPHEMGQPHELENQREPTELDSRTVSLIS